MALLAITRMTALDAVRQPVTWLMVAVSLALLFISFLFGMFNFENEDRMRMLATAGVAVGVLNGLFLAVVLATQTVHDEISSRTALTLFAKPVGRGQFLLGKALGVWLAVLAATAVVVAAHIGFLYWGLASGFDDAFDRRSYDHDPGWMADELRIPWVAVASAHLLGLGHTAILVSIAVVLALRLGLAANILVGFAVFVLGHVLAGFHWLGAGVIPALAAFNVDDCIQIPSQTLGFGYVLVAGLYTALFCAGCLLIGLAAFKRQDIP